MTIKQIAATAYFADRFPFPTEPPFELWYSQQSFEIDLPTDEEIEKIFPPPDTTKIWKEHQELIQSHYDILLRGMKAMRDHIKTLLK